MSELAWAAGLFEGEGCISVMTSRGRKYPRLTLAMSDEDVVRRFADVLGCGHIYVVPPRKEGHKTLWYWQVNGFEYTQAMLAMMWRWLGSRRKQRATEVLETTR